MEPSYRKKHDLKVGENNSGQLEALANSVKILSKGFFGDKQNDVLDGGIVEAVKLNSEDRKKNAEMELRTKVKILWNSRAGFIRFLSWTWKTILGAIILGVITLYLTAQFTVTKNMPKETPAIETK